MNQGNAKEVFFQTGQRTGPAGKRSFFYFTERDTNLIPFIWQCAERGLKIKIVLYIYQLQRSRYPFFQLVETGMHRVIPGAKLV